MILTLVDTTGIQSYIFGSNRLQENIGASYLVDQATGQWAIETFEAVKKGKDRRLYAGGGNFTALFELEERAVEFERKLSRKTLEQAPGLQLLTVHVPKDDSLPNVLDTAFGQMNRLKAQRPHSVPLLGLGVSRACRSTGLPASETIKVNGKPLQLAPEIVAKVKGYNTRGKRIVDMAHDRLTQQLGTEELGMETLGYMFPRDFEDLGATRVAGLEQSYLAVVHADGNGMGDRIRELGDQFRSDDTGYEAAIQQFSRSVSQASLIALRATLKDLIDVVEFDGTGGWEIRYPKVRGRQTPELCISLPQMKTSGGRIRWFLPFRPIVFGGDDMTFVCDGRLGVTLATAYLRHFEAATNKAGIPMTACAGIAIVKSHYPFARAYALAEDLCQEAKKYRKEILKFESPHSRSDAVPDDISCLDWHFGLSGLAGDLSEIRRREYRVQWQDDAAKPKGGSLELRPVTLTENPVPKEEARSWKAIQAQVLEFQGEHWIGKRNKLKLLREILREGPDKVEQFRTVTPEVGTLLQDNGWNRQRCTLFDAIELSDIHLPLTLPVILLCNLTVLGSDYKSGDTAGKGGVE